MNNAWWVQEDQMNDEQRAVFGLSPHKSVLIIGPPGSGKTNLLLLKASQMIRSKRPNILVLVFTRTLREFIATGGPQYAFSTDKIKTSNGWAIEFLRSEGRTPAATGTFEEKRRANIVAVNEVIESEGYGKIFQAIILDEAQDYFPEEIELFEKIAEVIYAAADKRQQVYRNEDSYFSQLVEKFGDRVCTLNFHYRNGPPICELADGLGKVRDGYIPMAPKSNYNDEVYPSTVEYIRSNSLEEEVTAAIERLQIQLDAYPGELLGILCPSRAILQRVGDILKASPLSDMVVVQGDDSGVMQFTPQRPICVCTNQSAKGLEFRAAHLISVPDIKGSLTRNLAYTSVTRAKTFLGIHHSRDLPGYFEQATHNGDASPAPVATLTDAFGN
jgi:energy-coupling factor transporter ATP-binding protein EcfA2